MPLGGGSAAKDVTWATLSPVPQEEWEALAVLGLQLGVAPSCRALGSLVCVRSAQSPCERAGAGSAAVFSWPVHCSLPRCRGDASARRGEVEKSKQ